MQGNQRTIEYIRHAKSQFLLLLFALAGVGIAIYLTTVHYDIAPLACSDSGFVNCARVLSSAYSVVPGTVVPITIPGLFWCLVMVALVIIDLRRPARGLLLAQAAWSLVGMLTVLYLVYVEIVLLHTLCAWCTAMHVLIFLMFLVTLVRLTTPQVENVTGEAPPHETTEKIRSAHR